MPRGVGAHRSQPRAGAGERAGDVGKRRAMAGDDPARVQAGDQVQRRGDVVEPGLAGELGKDDAEAVLPQRVGRDQHAMRVVVQHDRMRVVPRRGQHLPGAPAHAQRAAGLDAGLRHEALAALARRGVAQRLLVPVDNRLPLARRDAQARAELALQRGIAAAVVGVQVGVDDAVQRLAAQAVADQLHGLLGVYAVAAVDQHRAFTVTGEQHVVRRQPAALEDAQATVDGGVGRHGRRW